MPPPSCNQIISRLTAYAGGTLSASDESAVDAHLDQCDACSARVDALLARDRHLTPPQSAHIQRLLHAAYTLPPHKEAQGIEAIMALDAVQQLTQQVPSMAWAAADTSELDGVRERLGEAFVQRGPVALPPYTADLYVRDQHSALLAFSKDGQPTSELDGHTIDFYVTDAGETPPASVSQTIDAGVAVLDFTRLHLVIDDYARVGIRLYRDALPPIEGRL